jgi:hypothetical protein
LSAAAPVLGNIIWFEAVLKIDRALVNVVAVGKEKNAPNEMMIISACSDAHHKEGPKS